MSTPQGRSLDALLVTRQSVVALVYFLAGRLGLMFAVLNPSASLVWPASGVALAAVWLGGPRMAPGVFVGAFLVNFSTSGQFLMSLAIAAGNTAEALLARSLLERFTDSERLFDQPGGVWRFSFLAAALSTTVAATVGVASLFFAGITAGPEIATIWVTWWLGDAVGLLIVTPVIVLWARNPRVRWRGEQIVEAILIALGILAVAYALFGGLLPARFELSYLCIPLLAWVAFRFGPRESASAVLILASLALLGTMAGYGPFAGSSPSASLLSMQIFLGLTALTTLVFGATAAENRRGDEVTLRMATLVKSSNDAIIAKTLDGTITAWNPAAERMFGYPAEEVLGEKIDLIVPPEHRHEAELVLAKIRRGEVVNHFETVRTHKDGSPVQISLTVSPLVSTDGTIIGASKIVRDISERTRLEAERNALLARERVARVDAEAGNRAKDEFLAVLSHELRTPLNAVYGWARMLQSERLDAESSAKALDAIVRNANVQVQLIDDLLDVSRIISGKMRLDIRRVDLREVLDAALDAVRPAAEAKGLEVAISADPQGAIINGDPGRLQQIVWNLLINAVKFTPAGGRIDVRLRRASAGIELEVEDTGQGIEPHVLPFVFDRFRQWDSSSTRAHRGLGLGLALVRHLSELHGGTVSVQSAGEGRGSTFRVTLPAGVMVQGQPQSQRLLPAVNEGVRLDGLKVLVVDDDPDALELASTILGGAGAMVKSSRSASDALSIFQDWRPDVLVSDIEMPGEDGYSLIRKVRALETEGVRTPAVAVTAYGRMEDRVEALSAGYSMHVTKPVDPGELTTLVAGVTRVRPAPRRSE